MVTEDEIDALQRRLDENREEGAEIDYTEQEGYVRLTVEKDKIFYRISYGDTQVDFKNTKDSYLPKIIVEVAHNGKGWKEAIHDYYENPNSHERKADELEPFVNSNGFFQEEIRNDFRKLASELEDE